MLTAQPRFSGNGGHGKRLLETEEVSKRGLGTTVMRNPDLPGRKNLLAAARQAEKASFKAAKPQPLVKPPKVYSVGKSADDINGGKKQARRGRLVRDVGLITAGASIPIKSLKVALPTAAAGIGLNIAGTNQQKKGLKRYQSGLQQRAAVHRSAELFRQAGHNVKINPKHVEKREPQVWEVKGGKIRPTSMDKTKPGRRGDIVGMRLHRDQQGKRSMQLAAAGALGGIAGTAGSFAAKTSRGKIGAGAAGIASSVGSIAASRNARQHSGVEVRNLSQNTHYVVGGRKFKLDPNSVGRTKVNKRARTYDSEMNRHRRQGMYIAGGAAGSAGLAYSGMQDTREARNAGRRAQAGLARLRQFGTVVGEKDWQGTRTVLATEKNGELKRSSTGKTRGKVAPPSQVGSARNIGPLTAAEKAELDSLKHLRGAFGRKAGGKFAGAAALGGGSLALYRHSRSPQNRKRWN